VFAVESPKLAGVTKSLGGHARQQVVWPATDSHTLRDLCAKTTIALGDREST